MFLACPPAHPCIVTIFFFTPSKIVFLTPGKKEKNGFSPKSKWSAIFRSVISTMGFWLHRGIFWALAVFILGGFSLHGYKNSLVLSKLFKESGIFIVNQNLGIIGVKIQATWCLIAQLENITFLLHWEKWSKTWVCCVVCYHGDLQFWVWVFLGEEIPGRLRISLWSRYTQKHPFCDSRLCPILRTVHFITQGT